MIRIGWLRFLSLLLVGSLATGIASAQIKPSGKGFLFRSKYVKGESRKYVTLSIVAVNNVKEKVSVPFTMKVLSVKGEVGRIQFTIGPMMQNGKAMGQKQTLEASLNSRGQMVGSGPTVQQLGLVGFPKDPIKIGQGWKTNVETAAMGMPMSIQGEFKLVGFKQVGRRRMAVVATKMTNAKTFQIQGSGTMLLDTSDGSLVRSYQNMVMTMSSQQSGSKPMTIPIQVSIERK